MLALTHGQGDAHSDFVNREFDEIQHWCQIEAEAKQVSYMELVRPRMLNRTLIGLFTQICAFCHHHSLFSPNQCHNSITDYL